MLVLVCFVAIGQQWKEKVAFGTGLQGAQRTTYTRHRPNQKLLPHLYDNQLFTCLLVIHVDYLGSCTAHTKRYYIFVCVQCTRYAGSSMWYYILTYIIPIHMTSWRHTHVPIRVIYGFIILMYMRTIGHKCKYLCTHAPPYEPSSSRAAKSWSRYCTLVCICCVLMPTYSPRYDIDSSGKYSWKQSTVFIQDVQMSELRNNTHAPHTITIHKQ